MMRRKKNTGKVAWKEVVSVFDRLLADQRYFLSRIIITTKLPTFTCSSPPSFPPSTVGVKSQSIPPQPLGENLLDTVAQNNQKSRREY